MAIRLVKASDEDLPAITRIATSAFHPDTDALPRRLFPAHLQPKDLPNSKAAYNWRVACKACLELLESHLVVAVGNKKEYNKRIIRFCLQDAPSATSGKSRPNKEIQYATLNKKAFNKIKITINQDIIKTFRERGIIGIQRLSLYLFA